MNELRLLPLAFLWLGPASLADETLEAVLAASVGEWDGQLYYLDYQSGERFGIPMRVSASVTPDGVTLKRGVLLGRIVLKAADSRVEQTEAACDVANPKLFTTAP